MENINWICKSKTVNNNIVWMCNSQVKEHFYASPSNLLQGSTIFPNAVDITLGPANFGPSEEFCKDTTGYTKLGEWTMKFDNNYTDKGSARLQNGEFWAVGSSNFANGGWGGANFMSGGAWGNWVGMTAVDANGVNTQPAFLEVQLYQEFNPKWFVLIRNKTDPTSYYLMTRVNIGCFKYISSSDSDQYLIYRDGHSLITNPIDKKTFYDNLNIPIEQSFNGQSGGTAINNSVYEVFIKPFVRPTYPYKAEPVVNTFTPLSSDLTSKLFLWFDANDPNGDGTNDFNENDPVTFWKDKSRNQMKMIRIPASGNINDGDIIKNGIDGQPGNRAGAKERLPRIKKNFKNGLSVIRLNGKNGFLPMINHDDNTKKFIASYGNGQAPIENYTLVIVHYLTEYGNGNNLFSLGTWGRSDFTVRFDNYTTLGGPTLATNYGNNQHLKAFPGSLLNKWAISTITKYDSIQTYINGTLVNAGWQHGETYTTTGIVNGTYSLAIGNRDWGFQGDIAEIMFFDSALSDDERQKVEGYLSVKWNLTSILSKSNPYAVPPLPPIVLGSKVILNGTNPLGILFPGTVGVVAQIKDKSVLVYDSKNSGLVYWYQMSDLRMARPEDIIAPTVAPMIAPMIAPAI